MAVIRIGPNGRPSVLGHVGEARKNEHEDATTPPHMRVVTVVIALEVHGKLGAAIHKDVLVREYCIP